MPVNRKSPLTTHPSPVQLACRKGSVIDLVNRGNCGGGAPIISKIKYLPFIPPTPINNTASLQKLGREKTAGTVIVLTQSQEESGTEPGTQTQTQSQSTSVPASSTVDLASSLPLLTPVTSYNALYITDIPQEGSPGFARANVEIKRSQEESNVRYIIITACFDPLPH